MAFAHIFFKAHNAINFCEYGVVPAHAYVLAGMHNGAQLTHNNISGKNALAAKALYAASLARTVAAIAR